MTTRDDLNLVVGIACVKFIYLSVMKITNWLSEAVRGNGPRISVSTNLNEPLGGNSLSLR